MPDAERAAPSPDATVLGRSILPVVEALQPTFGHADLLERHGLGHINADEWYPMRSFLGLVVEVGRNMPTTLERAAEQVFATAAIPSSIDSFEAALAMLHPIYRFLHRGRKLGGWEHRPRGSGEHDLVATTPYPCAWERGLLRGLARRYEARISLSHTEGGCRDEGAAACHYLLVVR